MDNQNETICEDHQLSNEQNGFINIYVLLVEIGGNLFAGGIGVALNLITIIVLSSSKMRNNVFNRLLICLAVFDDLYLFCEISEVFRVWTQAFLLQHIFARFVYPIRSIFMCCSIYTNIALASERYNAIIFPAEYRVRKTTNMTRQLLNYIMPVFVLSFIYYTPKFFDLEVKETLECANTSISTQFMKTLNQSKDRSNCSLKYSIAPTELRINPNYLLWYMNISNIFITAFVPITILVYLNVNVYLSMRKFLKRRPSSFRSFKSMKSYQSQQSADVKKAFILFSIVFVFIFCHSLRLILNVDELLRLGSFQDEDQNRCTLSQFWEEILIPLNQLLLIINASAHFFIYVFFDTEFQQVLKELFTT